MQMQENHYNRADIGSYFACNVFDDEVMRDRLPKTAYQSLRRTIDEDMPLDPSVAEVVANAMKDWAIEKGATHFTHWFQPMTGITAEKHDAFISPQHDGKVIMEFSGKELIKGEPDASSFPSGGLRATFEARGYTAWDPNSYAFVKDGSLYIPTAFCSHSGDALDKKTPLLRSMQAINRQALRILRLFGNTQTKRVLTSVGAEQEYFLVDQALYLKRKDLIFTGRTLFGAKPPKGQELEDHYFGNLKERVSEYMKELDEELWKLGVTAKTKHNEAAPAQHELAPFYERSNTATDHNQLTMELMQKIARHHGLICLLHEKPFAGVNGSGKHNNWSLITNDGYNLLDPGSSPQENAQFLLFLCAVIKAVDEYADLLRLSAASASNDHRLGANEAPPAIISIFLGDELESIFEAIEGGTSVKNIRTSNLKIGVSSLPPLPRETTDRNRTSPFAFTGNKFEFRMVGSQASIAGANIMINTIVADALMQFADRLEAADDFKNDLQLLIRETIQKHKRIIFNGNNYSPEWVEEAAHRGLPNLVSTPDAAPAYIAPKNVALFKRHKVLNETEVYARYEIILENYAKVQNIEALAMVDMARKEILPACIRYSKMVCESLTLKKSLGLKADAEEKLASRLSDLLSCLSSCIDDLDNTLLGAKDYQASAQDLANYYRSQVFVAMQSLRAVADELETIVGAEYWPFPTYSELLFHI